MECLTTMASVTGDIANWGFCTNQKETEMLERLPHCHKKAIKKSTILYHCNYYVVYL